MGNKKIAGVSRQYFCRLLAKEVHAKTNYQNNNINKNNPESCEKEQDNNTVPIPPNVVNTINVVTTETPVDTIKEDVIQWVQQFRPSRKSANAVLHMLAKNNLNVPLDLKSLIKFKEKATIRTVAPGMYVHIGIQKYVENNSNFSVNYQQELILDVGIDGLPLYKSSNITLWPILGSFKYIECSEVFLIGAYLGTHKPANVDQFVHDFTEELKLLSNVGVYIENKVFKIKIGAFICDAPARSFICGVVGHNSFHGCSKCHQFGERFKNVTTFNTKIALLRTDEEFRNRVDLAHHNTMYKEKRSCLEQLGIGMVSQFPVEPMHLIDLGVCRKMLKLIFNNKCINFNLTREMKEEISLRILKIKTYVPTEFSRKPRDISELYHWKATEYRFFLLHSYKIFRHTSMKILCKI